MTTPPDDFKLELTGQMTVVIGLKDYGPMALNIDDLEVALEVLRVVLDRTDAGLNVETQTRAETKRLQKVLETIP